MSVKRRKDTGRWRARYRGPDGKERAQDFDRKIEAERWDNSQRVAVVGGDWTDPARARITIAVWAERWLAGRADIKPKTLSGYRSLLRTQILPSWGRVSLARVEHSEIVGWVAAMRGKGLSPSRIRQGYNVLHSLLDAAVRDQRIVRNPADGVKLPRLPEAEMAFLTSGELHQLAGEVGGVDDADGLLILLLGYVGLRWGEAVALRADRVDLMRGRLNIAEAVSDVDGHLIVGTTKNHQQRSVTVPRFLMAPLV